MNDESKRQFLRDPSVSSSLSHPLVRPVDIAQRRVQRLIAVCTLLAAGFALVPGFFAYTATQNSSTSQLTTTTVTATTDTSSRATATTNPVVATNPAASASSTSRVRAHWRWDGTTRSGLLTVAPGTAAGTKIPLNVDARGFPTRAVPPADPTTTAVVVIIGGLLLVAALAHLAVMACRRRFDRIRDRQWTEALERLLT
ncbi:Rv1733c family protein [Williamsia sterculiae]|uniref:Transmembrane protein n=1 Tax=Williamsia sterculiae TaxID=1344003 RepID=A0A1N7F6X7_9NOCA|nr:hypothetical protein [Williamsia sterculiae]SIR96080.1 hypothetical protein SAMN05445060_1880 [Williamsia sterculiae]